MNANANEGNSQGNESGAPPQTLQPGSQPSSGDPLTSLQARLNEVLEEQAKTQQALRTMQGEANKGTKKVESRVTELEKALRLKEKGLDDDEIMHRLNVDRLIEQGASHEPVIQTPVATVSRDTYLDEATRIVQDAGLSDTDPEVVRLMVDRARPDEYYKLAIRKLRSPAPEGAGVPPMRPEGVPQANLESLANSYVEEVRNNRGKPDAIRAIQAKYQEKGLETKYIHIP